MSKLMIVPTEDWEVLRNYIGTGESVVLVPQHVYDGFTPVLRNAIDYLYPAEEYDFCGEPDVYVDVVYNDEHCFIACARDYLDEGDE